MNPSGIWLGRCDGARTLQLSGARGPACLCSASHLLVLAKSPISPIFVSTPKENPSAFGFGFGEDKGAHPSWNYQHFASLGEMGESFLSLSLSRLFGLLSFLLQPKLSLVDRNSPNHNLSGRLSDGILNACF